MGRNGLFPLVSVREGLVSASFWWEGLVSAGLGSFQVVSAGFRSFRFLVITKIPDISLEYEIVTQPDLVRSIKSEYQHMALLYDRVPQTQKNYS